MQCRPSCFYARMHWHKQTHRPNEFWRALKRTPCSRALRLESCIWYSGGCARGEGSRGEAQERGLDKTSKMSSSEEEQQGEKEHLYDAEGLHVTVRKNLSPKHGIGCGGSRRRVCDAMNNTFPHISTSHECSTQLIGATLQIHPRIHSGRGACSATPAELPYHRAPRRKCSEPTCPRMRPSRRITFEIR